MTLTIEQDIVPISEWGLSVADLAPIGRRVLIDGKRVPPFLERIILAGLDTATAEEIERMVKRRRKSEQ